MLAGNKAAAETLRGLKSAIHNQAISLGSQDTGLSDEQAQKILASEAKARTEAADIYNTAGETERANRELLEKKIIDSYLPAQMGELELKILIDKQISALGATSQADMGKVIGAVKAEAGAAADGATIAGLVKEKLQ